MRVLLDTNVLVAAFATRGLCQDVLGTVIANHALLLGSTNLEELNRVLSAKLRMPPDRVDEVAEFVRKHAEIVTPSVPAAWPEGDPDDRWVVAAALDASADLIVSGDQKLIAAAEGRQLRVITPRQFWELLHRGEP